MALWVGGGILIGYMAKDQLNVFFEGLKNKAVGAIPTSTPVGAAGAPFVTQPTGQVPVRQALAGDVLYPGAFPPQEYDASNEYYGVAYPAEASSLLIPGRRYDRDYASYSQDQVNTTGPLW